MKTLSDICREVKKIKKFNLLFAFFIVFAVANCGLLYANSENITTNNILIENSTNVNINNENSLDIDNNVSEVKNNGSLKSINSSKENDFSDKSDDKEYYTDTPTASGDNISYTKNEILTASTAVKNYVNKYGRLPNYVTISKEKVSMSDFLYLISNTIVSASSGVNSNIEYKEVINPSNPTGTTVKGNLYKSNYISLSKNVISFINKNGKAPDFQSINLGNVQYQSIILTFSSILDFNKKYNRLPNYVNINSNSKSPINRYIPKYTPISTNNSNPIVDNPVPKPKPINNTPIVPPKPLNNKTTIKLSDIKTMGYEIEKFYNNNKRLPNYVKILNKSYSMSEFLYLSSVAINNINKGINTNIEFKKVSDPTLISGSFKNGTLYKKDYLNLASATMLFINKNSIAPNYITSNLGSIDHNSAVLGFSKVLEFSLSKNRLPNFLKINQINVGGINNPSDPIPTPIENSNYTIPENRLNEFYNGESLKPYLIQTTFCQVNDPLISSLALNLTKNSNDDLSKALNIFNFVRDYTEYSFYTNTKYGAIGTYKLKKGNCVDLTHLLIALSRSAGLSAKYVHGDCTFNSGNNYGHVWAQIKVGNKWIAADPSHNYNNLGYVMNWNINTMKLKGKYSEITWKNPGFIIV